MNGNGFCKTREWSNISLQLKMEFLMWHIAIKTTKQCYVQQTQIRNIVKSIEATSDPSAPPKIIMFHLIKIFPLRLSLGISRYLSQRITLYVRFQSNPLDKRAFYMPNIIYYGLQFSLNLNMDKTKYCNLYVRSNSC